MIQNEYSGFIHLDHFKEQEKNSPWDWIGHWLDTFLEQTVWQMTFLSFAFQRDCSKQNATTVCAIIYFSCWGDTSLTTKLRHTKTEKTVTSSHTSESGHTHTHSPGMQKQMFTVYTGPVVDVYVLSLNSSCCFCGCKSKHNTNHSFWLQLHKLNNTKLH